MEIIRWDGVQVSVERDRLVEVRTGRGRERVRVVAELARPGFHPGATAYDDYDDAGSVLVHSHGGRPAAVTLFDPALEEEWVGRLAVADRESRIAAGKAGAAMRPDRFRGIREACGLSIVDLTGILEVSRSIIQKWEAAQSPVPAGVAVEMEQLLDSYLAAVRTGSVDGLTDRQARQVAVLHGRLLP